MTDSDVGTYGEREGREMPSGRTEPDMSDRPDNGERHDTSPASVPPPLAFPAAPPPAHRDATPSASRGAPSVDSLLAAAVRAGAPADSVGEARAVAAFRAARESGGRTARTRRRDDWRPNARRRVHLSVRTTLAVLLASLTLGGVAFAAIGSAARGDKGADRESGSYENRQRPDRTTNRATDGTTDGAPTWPGPADVPRTAPSAPDSSAPAEQGGATRNPDESERRTGRQDDGKGMENLSPGGDRAGTSRSNSTSTSNNTINGNGSGSGNATPDSRRDAPQPAEPKGPTGSEGGVPQAAPEAVPEPRQEAAPRSRQEAPKTK
ncbi:hypothetical protein [Streptomyces sp. MB09-02B]|uniref:hypothetical protein n=1 Tax=Streptomyces sp. MB09-02B TaxID=3028667 RepID=UPI0029A1CC1D|nr:hypothetical protein [Streptomyces sp. MB09-02B]MDX3645646.1 hypothetical protein [Streptomyces sp. MB09-02B]